MSREIDGPARELRRADLAQRIAHARNYDELFEIIKRVVESEIGKHRAGLSLVLSDMPNTVGAYHPVGSNVIVVNRALIEDMRRFVKNEEEINLFVFTVLMHEYLHSLGLYDELAVRRTVQRITRNALGENHVTVRMAMGDWFQMYPQLAISYHKPMNGFEVVEKFDSGSTSYLG
ncbi:MAG: hypothetical protein ACRECH_10010 [Nitrososphaerales archaeon]